MRHFSSAAVTSACARRTGAASQASKRMHNTLSQVQNLGTWWYDIYHQCTPQCVCCVAVISQMRILSEVDRYYRPSRVLPPPGATAREEAPAGDAQPPPGLPPPPPPDHASVSSSLPAATSVSTWARSSLIAADTGVAPAVPPARASTAVSFSNARADSGEAFVQVGMYAHSAAGLVAVGAASSSGLQPLAAASSYAAPHDVTAKPLADMMTLPPPVLSETAAHDVHVEKALRAAREDARRHRQAAGLQQLAGAPLPQAAPPPRAGDATLGYFQSILADQMAASMQQLVGEVSSLLAPTHDRIDRLEAAVIRLAEAQQLHDTLHAKR